MATDGTNLQAMSGQTRGMFRGTDGRNYVTVFALVASLFFLWGVAHSILVC